jgi:hypothetical protein
MSLSLCITIIDTIIHNIHHILTTSTSNNAYTYDTHLTGGLSIGNMYHNNRHNYTK